MNGPIKPPCSNNFVPNRELHSPSGINLSNMMRQQDREWQECRQREQTTGLGMNTMSARQDKLSYCNSRQVTSNASIVGQKHTERVTEYICMFPNNIQQNETAEKYVLISNNGERMVCSYKHLLKLMIEKKLIVNNLVIGKNRYHNIHSKQNPNVVYCGDMITWNIASSDIPADCNITAEQLISDFRQGLNVSTYAREELMCRGKYKMILNCEEVNPIRIRKDSTYEDLCKDFEVVYNNIDTQKGVFRLQYLRAWQDITVGLTIFIAHIRNSNKLYIFIEDCDEDGACATDYFVVDCKSLRAILQNGEFYLTDYACKLGTNIKQLF